MSSRIVSIALEHETDIILARDRTRKIADMLQFDAQDRTRITTAVSEIVRNALEYGGKGRIEYWLDTDAAPQRFSVVVRDEGPGIADLEAVLLGEHRSETGMGVGILGARRLMDDFEIVSAAGRGTTVRMAKNLPRRAAMPAGRVVEIGRALARHEGVDPLAEIRRQNREMMAQLEELSDRQEKLTQLNKELEDTNRGVVALYAELDERADHLRRADELKTRFLSNMSHEFRTPLNSILALSGLLLTRADGPLGAEQEKQVQFIRKAAENLTELVNDLLDLAKVEAGKTVVTPVEFEIAELFSTLRGMLRPLLAGESVALIFEDAGDLPAMNTDEGKIAQILRNFISNAIKFTEHGEVRVWAEHDKLADTVTFKVRDTGIGISERNLEAIWQEFTQVATEVRTRFKGTGLGLPLSKRLSELLRGGVAVQSEVGQGSVFSLTVPRAYPLTGQTELDPDWEIDPLKHPLLIVEDNAADRLAFERMLGPTRYQPFCVASISQAKRTTARVVPSIVMLDIMLETEESWRLLIELKQREATQDVPVIVISSTQQRAKAFDLGADEYLSKPVDAAALVAALDRVSGEKSVTKVLVVDDEEVFRYVIRQLLPRGSFDLREASSGLAGLDLIRADPPDVVLLDLNMPAMDGFSFLDELRKLPGATRPPAIVVTSRVLDEAERRRIGGAASVVAKSTLNADALMAAIRRAVGPAEVTPA